MKRLELADGSERAMAVANAVGVVRWGMGRSRDRPRVAEGRGLQPSSSPPSKRLRPLRPGSRDRRSAGHNYRRGL